MSALDMEFALVLPNGEFIQEHATVESSEMSGMFNYLSMSMFGPPTETKPVGPKLFRTRADAQAVADQLRRRAKDLGVDDLLVRVVHRWCGPWTSEDLGEQIAHDFLTFIEGEHP